MRTNYFMSAMGVVALAIGMAACSNEEPAVNPGETDANGQSYVAVKIMSASSTGTKADETPVDYEEGTAAENALTAANTRFYFFNQDGTVFNMIFNTVNGDVTGNMVTPTEITAGTTDGKDVAGQAVLLLGKAAGTGYQGMVPYQAVCVANLSSEEFTDLQGKNLTELAKVVSNAKEYTSGNFVMSSSTWAENTSGSVVLAGHICNTPELAKNSPVNFFIERLAAKVNVSGLKAYVSKDKENPTNDANYTIVLDGVRKENVKLQVNLTGYKLLNAASKANTIKQLPTAAPWANESNPWSSADYHRSFWASTLTYDNAGIVADSKSFDILTDSQWGTADGYMYEYINDDLNNQADDITLTKRGMSTTAVAVRGYVQVVPEEGETAKDLDLVRWAGNYYDKNSFLAMVKQGLSLEDDEDLELVADAANANTYKVVKVKGNTQTDIDNFNKVMYWNGGATSFVINLCNSEGKYGVVRNHVYKVAVNSVVGLGVPGNEIITPEDNETFLGATLDVLNWRIVRQNVTLQ